jgi:broad-specificity NMP kinase
VVSSNLNEIIPLFDVFVLLTASKETLRYRLTNRTTNDFARTKDVQEWVFSWKDWWEDETKKLNPIVIENNNGLDDVVSKIIKIGNS